MDGYPSIALESREQAIATFARKVYIFYRTESDRLVEDTETKHILLADKYYISLKLDNAYVSVYFIYCLKHSLSRSNRCTTLPYALSLTHNLFNHRSCAT
jgi:hypothetical protein